MKTLNIFVFLMIVSLTSNAISSESEHYEVDTHHIVVAGGSFLTTLSMTLGAVIGDTYHFRSGKKISRIKCIAIGGMAGAVLGSVVTIGEITIFYSYLPSLGVAPEARRYSLSGSGKSINDSQPPE